MKTIKFTLVAALMLSMSFCMSINKASAQGFGGQYDEGDRDVSYQTFYDELSPYGDWVYDNQYGYVWRPNMGPDFMPYRTGGHWISSEIGWTWASDYQWGWAPFHYGRWKFDTYLGWYWIPGYEWAPAWVVWSSNNDYYGWAPMAPGWNISVSINIGSIPSNYWVFAPPRYLCHARMYDYCAPVYNNVTIVRNVTVINNYGYYNRTRYVCGPRVHEYNTRPGCYTRPVPVRECHEPRSTRCDDHNVYVYRPRIVNHPSCRPPEVRGREYFANRNAQPRNRGEYLGNSRPNNRYENNRRNDYQNDNRPDNRYDINRQRQESPQPENRRNDNWVNQQRDNNNERQQRERAEQYAQQQQERRVQAESRQAAQQTERYAQRQQQQERRSQPEYRQVSQPQEQRSRENSSYQSAERSSRGQQQRSESHSEGRPRGRN